MIGIIGEPRRDGKSSFAELISYCKAREGVAHVGTQNIYFKESAAEEMESLAFENPRCKDPLMHIILSWREMELPTKEQIDEAVSIALKELDLQDCQAVWIVHADTENRHVHIAANRIHPETHRAIQPANRWTHKAIQRAARKIEIAQGWEIEAHGSYQVTEDGEVIEKAVVGDTPKLSKTALDLEAHTAAKSGERICQETAAPIMRGARTWEELHRKLAEQGIAFERKGSGAVLVIGEIVIKASKAGRDISLSKLEARFGEYRPRETGVVIENRPKEPIERVDTRKVTGNWERYTAERERYFKEKKEILDALVSRQKEERAELSRGQKAEREKVFTRSWKGMGSALNRQRSVTAAAQQSEKLNLRDCHDREYKETKKHFPSRFPNFKTWLETVGENTEAFLSFRYPDAGTIRGMEETPDAVPVTDIRAFTPAAWNKGGIAYREEGDKEAQFIDYGKKIIMAEKCGEAAVLAALQLANQKWGGAVINGTDEYKKLCVELAIRHGLKLSNHELAAQVEEAKKRMSQQHKQEANSIDRKDIFNRYAEAVGAERYRVTVTESTESGTKAFIHDRHNGGYEGKTKEEILEAMSKFGAYSHYGKNIIVTPISSGKHHILIDDLTPEKLKQFREDGYSPGCVIESSPENYQAVLTIPSLYGDSAKDREAANRLTKELNLKYGDPKLSGSLHGHRLPPFENKKPKHKRDDGSYPGTVLAESNGGICEKAAQKMADIQKCLKEAEEKSKQEIEAQRRFFTGVNYRPGDPNGAYWIHYRDIAKRQTGDMDHSRVDGMIGIRMRATDYTQSEVESAIETNAPAMRRETMSAKTFEAKYRNRDWRKYAAETTEKYVFGTRGAIQFQKALDYRPYYMRLEGRDAIAEQRVERERREARAESKKSTGR